MVNATYTIRYPNGQAVTFNSNTGAVVRATPGSNYAGSSGNPISSGVNVAPLVNSAGQPVNSSGQLIDNSGNVITATSPGLTVQESNVGPGGKETPVNTKYFLGDVAKENLKQVGQVGYAAGVPSSYDYTGKSKGGYEFTDLNAKTLISPTSFSQSPVQASTLLASGDSWVRDYQGKVVGISTASLGGGLKSYSIDAYNNEVARLQSVMPLTKYYNPADGKTYENDNVVLIE